MASLLQFVNVCALKLRVTALSIYFHFGTYRPLKVSMYRRRWFINNSLDESLFQLHHQHGDEIIICTRSLYSMLGIYYLNYLAAGRWSLRVCWCLTLTRKLNLEYRNSFETMLIWFSSKPRLFFFTVPGSQRDKSWQILKIIVWWRIQ